MVAARRVGEATAGDGAATSSTTSEWKQALDVIQGEGLMMPGPFQNHGGHLTLGLFDAI